MLKTDCNSENTNIINILNTNDIIICACTGNIELDLIFKHKIDLPQFSCIDLLKTSYGKEIITNCILKYINIIKKNNIYGIIDTQTFRCSKKWGKLLNCNEEEIRNLNKEAINKVDNISNYYPMFYMINCVHPKYFVNVLFENRNKKWIKRIKGIKPNPSTKTHEELNNSTELDSGDINKLSNYCENIRKNFKHINIYGGCCGSDEVHIEEIYKKVKLL